MADKYPGLSPFIFSLNNPIKYLDPNGKEVIKAHEEDKKNAESKYNLAKLVFDSFKGNKEVTGYRDAKKELRKSRREFNRIDAKYKQVEKAINDLKKYNNDAFQKLDNLDDEHKNRINVYIEAQSFLRTPSGDDALGLSHQTYRNGHFITSQYGINTTLIQINTNLIDPGFVLAHEAGHTVFNVTKWSFYFSWLTANPGISKDGHGGGNPSGEQAVAEEHRYTDNRKRRP